MNNISYVRPMAQHRLSTNGPDETSQIFRSALLRLLAQARTEQMENTIMTLELALTAIDIDMEEKAM